MGCCGVEMIWLFDVLVMVLFAGGLLIPLVICGWMFWKRRHTKMAWFVAWVVGSVASYVCVVGGVIAITWQYRLELKTFDWDGDDSYSPEEMAAGGEKAMRNLTHDTGRNFAPFVYLIFCPLYVEICFVGGKIVYFVGRRVLREVKREEDCE